MIKVNRDVLLEYERLRLNDLISTIKRNAIVGDRLTVLFHDMKIHSVDIVTSNRAINNDIAVFMETQIEPSDSSCEIIETLNLFITYFNNKKNKFLSLYYRCRNDAADLNKFDAMEYLS